MRGYDLSTINLDLNVIEDLFIEPSYNPFDSNGRFQSGIEELVEQVRELSLKEPLKICLTLSSQPDCEDINEATSNALRRYCSVRIRGCEKTIHEIQNQGKRDLLSAVVLSFILILGEFSIIRLPFIPEFLTYLLATGFGIIAWVILWPPLDKLLYEWRPCRRSQRIFRYLQSAVLDINCK